MKELYLKQVLGVIDIFCDDVNNILPYEKKHDGLC